MITHMSASFSSHFKNMTQGRRTENHPLTKTHLAIPPQRCHVLRNLQKVSRCSGSIFPNFSTKEKDREMNTLELPASLVSRHSEKRPVPFIPLKFCQEDHRAHPDPPPHSGQLWAPGRCPSGREDFGELPWLLLHPLGPSMFCLKSKGS